MDESEHKYQEDPGHINKPLGKPPVWVDRTGRELQASDFWDMAQYCSDFVQNLLPVFINFQEQFKAGALTFTRMAELLETAQKSERRTKVENVFTSDPPDPGPTTNKPN